MNKHKKLYSARTVLKDDIENHFIEIIESFLDNDEMLASLAVDMAHHFRDTHSRGEEILKGLEQRRRDVVTQLANFVKAIAMGIMNETTAEAMASLEEKRRELDEAIRIEQIKATCSRTRHPSGRSTSASRTPRWTRRRRATCSSTTSLTRSS